MQVTGKLFRLMLLVTNSLPSCVKRIVVVLAVLLLVISIPSEVNWSGASCTSTRRHHILSPAEVHVKVTFVEFLLLRQTSSSEIPIIKKNYS